MAFARMLPTSEESAAAYHTDVSTKRLIAGLSWNLQWRRDFLWADWNASAIIDSLFFATSELPERPRSNTQVTSASAWGPARSRDTRRRMYSAKETPSSLARCRARR